MGELRARDLATVREQLGREPTTPFTIVARCPGGHPLVIRNHPVDARGEPFPTLFWLTCPAAVKAVARLEADGWIGRLNERFGADGAFRSALEAAHGDQAAERGRDLAEAEGWGGVGGTRRGVKCLHAHYANHLAGGEDPVGSWVAERVEPIHPGAPVGRRVAAVDLGTNSIRLLVLQRRGADEPAEVARDMVITRIGADVDRTGRLDPEALSRTVGVLGRYARRASALHVDAIRVGATSAVRDATDRDELASAVRQLTGAELEVLSGEREAALSFLGGTRGLNRPEPFAVVDIGGGSTEFVVGSDAPSASISTQMGSVRLTERHVRHDPPTADELAALRRAVDHVLDDVDAVVPVSSAATLVSVAGTATTVQGTALGLPTYDPDAIHRTDLSFIDAERVLAELAGMTSSERAALPVMPRGREDVIVAGATILVAVMHRWGFERTVVSETDILDGLAIELLGSAGGGSSGPAAR